ncbi:MAG: hypothetical protein AB8B69_03100 [Chitinophagales bacterium]
MKIIIASTDNFEKEAKKLIKKYRSLTRELSDFQQTLLQNPRQGIKIKEDTYKIRLAVKSKGRGKSGGMRVITFIHEVVEQADGEIVVYLISIYDKSNTANISDKFLSILIDDVVANISLNEESTNEQTDKDNNTSKLD